MTRLALIFFILLACTYSMQAQTPTITSVKVDAITHSSVRLYWETV